MLFLGAAAAAALLYAGGNHRRDRTLPYLALFMGLYGVRLIVDTDVGAAALGLSDKGADHVVVGLELRHLHPRAAVRLRADVGPAAPQRWPC